MQRMKVTLLNRARRPRLLVWLGLAVVALVVVSTLGVVGTSTNWFCTEPCHTVHADNTLAFQSGSHVMASCVTCHEPINASPLTFVFMKMTVAPDAIPTMLGTFELPMNENHEIALTMADEYCTQCHNLANRTVSASAGIIIDHAAHAAEGVNCTSCHNRVAHPEGDVEYVLEGDEKHEDWMAMDACFRCHGLEETAAAPGRCDACHPADFDLLPTSHEATGWYAEYGESGGHAAAYTEEASRVVEAQTWATSLVEVEHRVAPEMPYERTINTCYTCHAKAFCTACHGVEMPHPADFAANHGKAGLEKPQACATCHARTAAEAKSGDFCNACHHPESTPGTTWRSQHDDMVKTKGAGSCFECHSPTYCAACHVGGPEAAQRYLRENAGN